MSGDRPARVLDPVCGMTVDVHAAEDAGLTIEHSGRTYAFCREGCLRAFREEPDVYAAKAEQAVKWLRQFDPALGGELKEAA